MTTMEKLLYPLLTYPFQWFFYSVYYYCSKKGNVKKPKWYAGYCLEFGFSVLYCLHFWREMDEKSIKNWNLIELNYF